MNEGHVVGAVLAGGRGRRIGVDKAALELGGRPLASYAVAALQAAGLDVSLALRAGQAPPDGLDQLVTVHDAVERAGPLAGLHAVLKSMPGEWALVVSCDQPFVRVNLLHGLLSHAECSADAAAATTSAGLQPLPGLYRRSCIPVIEAAIERGDGSMREVLRRLRLCELRGAELDALDLEHASFINVNTPTDYLAARRLVAAL